MSGYRFRASASVGGVGPLSDEKLDALTSRLGGTVVHSEGVMQLVWRFDAASMVKAAQEAARTAEEALLPLGYEASTLTVRKAHPAQDAEELAAMGV